MRSTNRTGGLTFVQEARRNQIIGCAIQALAEDGYPAASLANIAARAKISKSVVAHYFGSKDQLVEEVAKAVFAAATADLMPRLQSATTMRERLSSYLEGRVLFLQTHRDHMLALFEIWTNLRTADGSLRFGESDATETIDAIEQLLRAGQRSGEFGNFDTDVMAMAIRQAVDGVLLTLRGRPDLDLARYAHELVALFLRATANPDSSPEPNAPNQI